MMEWRPESRGLSLAELSLQHFEPLLEQTFTVEVPGHGPLPLTLSQCRASGVAPERPGGAFVLTFHCDQLPPEQYLLQGTYEISHPGLGAWPIFLTPTMPDRRGVRYEAVFS